MLEIERTSEDEKSPNPVEAEKSQSTITQQSPLYIEGRLERSMSRFCSRLFSTATIPTIDILFLLSAAYVLSILGSKQPKAPLYIACVSSLAFVISIRFVYYFQVLLIRAYFIARAASGLLLLSFVAVTYVLLIVSNDDGEGYLWPLLLTVPAVYLICTSLCYSSSLDE